VLIGIDMLGVQSPDGVGRESGRLGRQLASALVARDSPHRYILYTHEGLPTDRVPSGRNALRVSLPEGPGGPGKLRPTIQRVLDHNPDGLDWLVLLDPFDEAYGGMPPDSPPNGVRVASLITDLSPGRVDDRRLSPLRHHDAILAFAEEVADECRRRLPTASRRIERLGLGLDESWTGLDASEPMTGATAERLGRLGIDGPFLLANIASGSDRSNLIGLLETYHRLPLDHRKRHQLVVAGKVDDPWGAIAHLHDRGCDEGLVLVGPVDEPTLRTLYGRCSVFVSPSFGEASTVSLIEAMSQGTPSVAGRSGSQSEVLGDAGLLADPADPSAIAEQVVRVLSDVDLGRDLRKRALARSGQFSWEPVVEGFIAVLERRESRPVGPTLRFDRAHVARLRVAVFAASPDGRSSPFDGRIVRACRASHDVDLYLEPGDPALLERLPVEFGGFDARQFARNDDILAYHAVVHLLPDVFSVKGMLRRLNDRPGLVFFRDEASLDRIGFEDPRTGLASTNTEAEVACSRLHELFLTSSRLVVRSSRNLAAIRSYFPLFADRVVEMSTLGGDDDPGSSTASRLLAEFIEGCAAVLPGGAGRPRHGRPGWMLESAQGAGESYLEAR
jgi:glycosyltransferase involved in cell wall biosynthesis